MLIQREINLLDKRAFTSVKALLEQRGLSMIEKADFSLGIFDGETLVGIGSRSGKILQGIAVLPQYEGIGLSTTIVTNLLSQAFAENIEHLMLFTKPEEGRKFVNLGFSEVGCTDKALLLEWGTETIKNWSKHISAITIGKPEHTSIIVLNGNPFTLGHLSLVQRALNESEWLYIIVVEEDCSLFPFSVRYDLTQKNTAHLNHVTVLPGGPYVISLGTFPSYFLPEEEKSPIHARLDLEIFARWIAPSLKIRRRYVGHEPYCPVTQIYNFWMKKILPTHGIEVKELQRKRIRGEQEFISASLVRKYIRKNDIEKVKELVPPATWEYINSPEGQFVLEHIKESTFPH